MRATIKDLLFALHNGFVAELYPAYKIIPRPSSDKLLTRKGIFLRNTAATEILLNDNDGSSVDPNPKRRNGYTEATWEDALCDELIEDVECERPHPNYLLTRKGLDLAIELFGPIKQTIFIATPSENEKDLFYQISAITPDEQPFDILSLKREMTIYEARVLGDPFNYHFKNEDLTSWVTLDGETIYLEDHRWNELIERAQEMIANGDQPVPFDPDPKAPR